MVLAAGAGHEEMIRKMLRLKADVNHVSDTRHTAITKAAREGQKDLVKTLLVLKASVQNN